MYAGALGWLGEKMIFLTADDGGKEVIITFKQTSIQSALSLGGKGILKYLDGSSKKGWSDILMET
eukprot:6673955-Ditylum_brightwellii.AAC.1